MIRFTANFPRAVVESGFPFDRTPAKDWLISISDVDTPNVRPVHGFGWIMFARFNDTEDPTDPHCISDETALQIVALIEEARKANANVWVNCHAGMCRSGAIVEVLRLLGWVVADEFSPRRVPNLLVFNKIRMHFSELLNSWEV